MVQSLWKLYNKAESACAVTHLALASAKVELQTWPSLKGSHKSYREQTVLLHQEVYMA